MKKVFSFLLVSLAAYSSFAQQPGGSQNLKQGSITLWNGLTVSGDVKPGNLRSGKITIVGTDNKKVSYEAAAIKECTIDGNKYVGYKNDLFLEVVIGQRISLYQKQSSSGGKISYNGAEPVMSAGSEGSVGDYFLSADGGKTLVLTSKKKVAEDVKKLCSNCSVSGDFADVKQAVANCNNCN